MATDAELLEMNGEVRAEAERLCDWVVGQVMKGRDRAKILQAGAQTDLVGLLDVLVAVETVMRSRRLPVPHWDGREFVTKMREWLEKENRLIAFPTGPHIQEAQGCK